MKLFKLDLLTLLISLFILSSCQETESIGLDVDSATEIKGSLIDTITINASTVVEDSIITNSLEQYPLGYLNDPIMGKTSASIGMSLTLDPPGLSFGTSPVLDSAVLVLFYGKEFHGDSTSKFQIEVRQLANALNESTIHYNTKSIRSNSQVLGSKFSNFNLKDSVKVNELVKGKPDVQRSKAPHLRIQLDKNFISNNLLIANTTTLSSNVELNKALKGLYLSVNNAQTTGKGGIAFFNLTDSSRLEVYYKSQNGTATDTTLQKFPIKNNSSPVVANFKHDYTGTAIQTQLNNPNTKFDNTFVQGLAGLRTKLNFPYLDKLKNLGNITINKAELVVTVVGGTDQLKPAKRLLLYQTDIAKQRQLVQDFATNPAFSLTDLDFGGFYDSSNKRYKFVITTYIQDMLRGRTKQYDTYIAPVTINYNRQSGPLPSGATSTSAVIGSGKPGVSYKMKLNIIYSKVN
jgi:hypothetical protein